MAVFIVDKPLGLSSHDVVSKTRKLLGTKRVGHAGTLDPLASGVLVLLSEESTKLSPFLSSTKKHYLAWVSFGAGTPTLDAEGPIESSKDASGLSRGQIEKTLPAFFALKEQLPPKYSAIKKAGVKAYKAARKGETLNLPLRAVSYYYIELLGFARTQDKLPQYFSLLANGNWQSTHKGIRFELPQPLGNFPTALFSMCVQAGTYIRSFARDLGAMLDLPAHLSGLVRTRAGKADLKAAVKLESIVTSKGLDNAELLNYPLIYLDDNQVSRVRQGQRLKLEFKGKASLVNAKGELVAIVKQQDSKMKLLRVWV